MGRWYGGTNGNFSMITLVKSCMARRLKGGWEDGGGRVGNGNNPKTITFLDYVGEIVLRSGG